MQVIDKMADAVKNVCPKCPFNRDTEPGYLGGSGPEVYIGQIGGPFYLPCHEHYDFENDPNWRQKACDGPQCAGAAIFRTHVGVAPLMPPGIATLPANHAKVFSSFAEFLAHHGKMSVGNAELCLAVIPPRALTAKEARKVMLSSTAIIKPVRK
jgi:hypothetical protein